MAQGDLPRPGKAPCGSCPYRRDVPAGIWEASEYQKLPAYDRETPFQPSALFFCHQQDGKLCAGWVGCHDTAHLLSMRFHRVAPETFDYESPVPLFASGAEAAAHGLSGVNDPDDAARLAIRKLERRRRDRDAVFDGDSTQIEAPARSAGSPGRSEAEASPNG